MYNIYIYIYIYIYISIYIIKCKMYGNSQGRPSINYHLSVKPMKKCVTVFVKPTPFNY